MNEELTLQADQSYRLAERKAAQYFASLYEQVQDKSYVPALTKDFQLWKKSRSGRKSLLSFFSQAIRKPDSRDYHNYIRWLNQTGRLDSFLDRSVSYIYMRDLGKSLKAPATQSRIRQVVADVKMYLNRSESANGGAEPELISLEGLYRWARKEGIETAIIWVIDKLKAVSAHIPEEMNAEHSLRKLIKIIVGVVLHVIEELADHTPSAERARRLDEAIRLGYSYGLTYPFIDDLLDSPVLTVREKELYSRMIRTSLLTGTVPEPGKLAGSNKKLIRYVYAELRDAYAYIKKHQRPETQRLFFEQSYIFFHAQDTDRTKELSNADYTNEELYVPIILKSAFSRLIVRSVIRVPADEGFDERTFYYGIYNQLADDFADMFEDKKAGAVTPFTYYWTYGGRRSDLINPFELYWAVISHLLHHVYDNDAKARDVILARAVNGLKRYRRRAGEDAYNEIVTTFASGIPEFNLLVQKLVRSTDDVNFFDKLLRDRMVTVLKNDRIEEQQFLDKIATVRRQIDSLLLIKKQDGIPPVKEAIIDAANYSLEGGGKRLRPILAWVMGVDEYGLQAAAIAPLLRSLEYMHTASLIFDDLPSQDNASVRRGRPTLHEAHDSATAELTGLFLIQKATEEQASLQGFDAKTVLSLIQYSSRRAGDMCAGQAMDLRSKGKVQTLEQLNRICFYKTGIAFEASLVMPAILAKADEAEIAGLSGYAYHAGIAFQIKDDLLDAEGDVHVLGKPAGKDIENDTSTFVTVLGRDGAKKEMWEHYCLAMEEWKKLPRAPVFLKHLLTYIISRDR
ncbi:polyprenyl synthetase family protein [Paenibacillus hemerocallicola]|uniref:Polyprenyl synthetase family protein n=1 Tax=Paenibacillus hemerocallicola TaxID=1172614 RepID=A0A5C4T560_9BACL|nr:polyprenyl synthetase family protein [Paenibacillus hemerocallicola]TNJ63329.1 polyprenyl synthetase family protein [Paenibacillus hemerocallicola]